jgi:dCTP diphosphatase
MAQEQSFKALQEALIKFNSDRSWGQYHSPKNLSMALVSEATELMDEFMWLTEDQSRALTEDQRSLVRDEVGDVMICLLNFCHNAQIDPIAAAQDKILKNAKKYPVP